MAINYIAVLFASIISMIIGSFWYSPLLFGNLWIKLQGFTKKDIGRAKDRGMKKIYFISFISSIVMSYVLAYLISSSGIDGFFDGAILGFIVWLGFVATIMINSVLWENKSFELYLLNILYHLISLIIIGGIIGFFS